MYGISLGGHTPELVTKPLIYYNVSKVDDLVILTDYEKKAVDTAEEVKIYLKTYGIKVEVIKVREIFNFHYVFLSVKKIIHDRGKPLWINVSAGPGMAIAALVLAAKNSDIIYYRESGIPRGVIRVNSTMVDRGYAHINKALSTLSLLKQNGQMTFKEITDQFPDLSKATVSRRLSILENLEFITIRGVGRGRNKKEYIVNEEMTQWLM